jgi:redox-sensing transcriptional repressor
MEAGSIPKATLGRIPLYIQYLRELPDDNDATISATKIARGLFLGEVQVRKDLALISGRGKPKIGYERAKLMKDLERHLGYENLTNAVLIGAGKLGRALLDYEGFEEFGVRILAGFDCNEKTLQVSGSKSVYSIKALSEYCDANNVKVGIITVGQGSAQEVCDKLVACGIKAIWNFAPCVLSVPADVLLKQENLALSLAHLNSKLKTKNNK